MRFRGLGVTAVAAAILTFAGAPSVARAQVADALSNYDATNALGYTEPLRGALLGGLPGGLFERGVMRPEDHYFVRVSYQYLGIRFLDEDREFLARGVMDFPRTQPDSEGGVRPTTPLPVEADAPTIAGSSESSLLTASGTDLAVRLPGGLDLETWTVLAPQVTVGWGLYELTVRYADANTGDTELGDFSLFGVAARTDVTRYVDADLPVRIALAGAFQSMDFAGDLVQADVWTLGVQVGRRFDRAHLYSGVMLDTIDFALGYTGLDGARIETSDSESRARLNVGGGLDLSYVHLHGEVGFNRAFSFALGLSFGI